MQAQEGYFQQRVDTRLQVTLDDTAQILNGFEELYYQNNSPDTLSYIYFHLWPNAYKNDRTAYVKQAVENNDTKFYFAKHSDRGYIDSLHFEVDGSIAEIAFTGDIDIIKLILPHPLMPGSRIKITTPFRVKIPFTFSRMGHSGQSYQISQWFPKPAVYDKYGWHPIPYLDQGEFYSEYGSYDVSITLPKNYIVMATGNLLNTDEEQWLGELSHQPLPNDTLYKNSFPASSSETKTLHYIEDNIHDFAWFADKRWVVRKDTVAVPGSDNIVTAYTAFLPKDQKGWANGVQSLKTTVVELSRHVGPYPYKTIKAVEGSLEAGGGMEYPTVTVISPSNSPANNHTVIVHEAGHNWFYGMLGSNERLYPWMDEGINSFYEKEITKLHNGQDTGVDSAGAKKAKTGVALSSGNLTVSAAGNLEALAFSYPMSVHTDMASGWRADTFKPINYEGDVYEKTPYMMRWLRGYMGDEDFEAAMKDYFNQWKFKHPYPEDFEKIMKAHTAKDIDWFFKLMNSDEPVDFAIKKITTSQGINITVKNKGRIAAPVRINMMQHDGKDTAFVWTDPFKGTTQTGFEVTDFYKKIWIYEDIPDYMLRNNSSESKLKVRPILGLNADNNKKLWVMPAVGYNYYDGFMLGALFHNITVPQNKFQYILAPMFAFGSKTFSGTGRIGYTAYIDEGWLHDIQLNLEGKTFSYGKSDLNIDDYLHARYVKAAPEVVFNLRKPYARSTVERSISIKGYWIGEDQLAYNQDAVDSLYRPFRNGYANNFYARLQYNHSNYRTFNPFSYRFEGQMGKDFAKLSVEGNLKIDYFKKGKALYLRGFAGKFFNFADNDYETSRYWFATTYTGANDYLYDGTFLGRNESTGFASQQVAIRDGGFSYRTQQYASPVGISGDWLFAVNVKTDLPLGKIPLRAYANLSTFSNAKKLNPSGAQALFEIGLELHLTQYISVYFPVYVSKDYSEYSKSILGKNRYLKTISFSVNIENIDWFNLPKMLLRKL